MNTVPSESRARQFQNRHYGSRLYVWIVTAGTILILAIMTWPMAVERFQSSVTFQLRFDPTTNMEKREIGERIVNEIRLYTETEQLGKLMAAVNDEISSPILLNPESEKIRNAIRIQSRQGSTPNSLWYRVSLVGNGSTDEVQFVNALVSRITSNIGTSVLRQSAIESIDRLTADFTTQQNESQELADVPLESALSSIRSAGNELQIIIDNLKNLDGIGPGSGASVSSQSQSDLSQAIARLETEKQQKLAEANMNPYHPQVASIQRKIEQLKMQMDPTIDGPFANQAGADDSTTVTNQFASSRNEVEVSEWASGATIKNLIDEIEMIDLERPRQQLDGLRRSIEEQNANRKLLIERMNARAKDQLTVTNSISFDQIEVAERSRPIGGVPSTGKFLLLAVFAGLIATAITWRFDPATRKRRFSSLHQVQSKLGIPVVGTLRARPINTVIPTHGARLAGLIVTVCEWVLLLMLIGFIIAALMNSEVIGALMENPFEAASKTFWLIAPRG